MRICIVTPDIVGPIKNGGIGTHCHHFAKFARESGHEVTVVFTGPVETGTPEEHRDHYREMLDVRFVNLEETRSLDIDFPLNGAPWFIERSLNVARWLAAREEQFDLVMFQDWHANGFVSVQMKRAGVAFRHVTLATMLHSPAEWQREGMKDWPLGGVETMMLDHCERHAAEFSDLVIAPSRHMFDWVLAHGWKLPARREVLPLLLETPAAPEPVPFSGRDVIFFGRLETRKGLEIFAQALLALEGELKSAGKTLRLHFLGKNGLVDRKDAAAWLGEHLGEKEGSTRPWEIRIVDGLGHDDAMNYLLAHRDALVVTPSLLDNMPYAVLEAVTMGLNILPTSVGGIPEIFTPGTRLPEANARGLLTMLRPALVRGHFARLSAVYTPNLARARWTSLLKSLGVVSAPAKGAAQSRPRFELWPGTPEGGRSRHLGLEPIVRSLPAIRDQRPEGTPVVTVCVPYFNAGEYLPDTLESLASQTYGSFEVVVIDDGSTDARSIALFDAMREMYSGHGWRFLRKPNEGIGATRNFAASRAQGRYLVFMDSDNIANPHMLERMVGSLEHSGADCMTCYFTAFNHGDDHREVAYGYVPLGADLASGMVANVFGDANFIVRREVFQSLGGFGTDRRTSYEDYEFLFRLVERGWDLAVIPQFLFYYRHLAGGFSRVTNARDNQLRAISAALEGVPDWQRRFLTASLGCFMEADWMRRKVAHLHEKNLDYREKISTLKEEKRAAKATARSGGAVREESRPHLLKRLERGFRSKVWRPLIAACLPGRPVKGGKQPAVTPAGAGVGHHAAPVSEKPATSRKEGQPQRPQTAGRR